MEISNLYDDLSITDVQEKAAPVGDSLRVAVTKTSAQGKAAQSATPNLMSFSTDENSIWFNKKNYGAVVFKNLFGLSTSSSNEEIKTALGGNTYNDISQMVDRGILFLNINNKALQHVMIRVENTGSSEGDYLHIRAFSDASDTTYIKIRHYNGVFNVPRAAQRNNIVFRTDIMDEFAPLSDYPLSANMGKKLNDEKLAKTDVVNNFTTNDITKPLSAAKGKELYDTITSNRVTINFDTAENTTDNDTIKACLSNLDSTSLIKKLKNGAIITDSSSSDWVITVQKLQDTEVIFAGIVFRSFRVYTKNITVTISGNNYTNMAVITANRYVPYVVNNLTSSDAANALSAAQGKALNDKISVLGSVYRIKGTKNNIADVFDISNSAQKGDVWNVIEAFTLDGKPYPAGTNVVCIQTWAEQSVDPNKNWDALGGTVDLSPYARKSDVEASEEQIWEQFGVVVNKDEIVNTLTSTDTNKPLSAAQGKKLQDEKLSKTDANSTYLTKVNAESTYAKKADGISHYSIGELTALSSNPTQEQLKTALGTPSAFRNAIDAGELILVTGNANVQSQKSATCIIDSGNVIVKYLHPGNNDWIVIAKCVPASSGDNWDNVQFSVRIIKSSDISYTTNLPDSLVVPQTIGGINKGTKVSDLEGSTISQMFDNLLFPEVQPTVQSPSASISFKDTFSSDGIYEVGATAPITINFNTSFNRGTCTVVGQANKNRAGALNSSSSFIYYGGDTSTKTLPAKITLGTMQYNYQAAYAQGDTLITSKGNKASVTPNPLPAGSVKSSNLTIFGTYPYYCNGQSASYSSGDTNFPSAATPSTKLPLYKWADTLVGAKFASEAATGTRMQFMYSSRKKVTKVEFYNTISGKWETFGTSNYNSNSSTKVYNIQGVNETYNILTTTGPLSGSVQYRFTMTNA